MAKLNLFNKTSLLKIKEFFQETSEVLQILFISIFSTALSYYFYFAISAWVWDQNIKYDISQILPWFHSYLQEQDGLEIYALYLLLLSSVGLALLMQKLFYKISNRHKKIFYLAGSILIFFFIDQVRFDLPMSSHYDNKPLTTFLNPVCFTIWPLIITYIASKRTFFKKIEFLIVVVISAFSSFVAIGQTQWFDASFIFSPAIKLLQGVNPSDIYFQYDFYFSFLAMLWMRLGFDISYFRLIIEASYFMGFLALYSISRKVLSHKVIALFLFLTLVIMRIYASPYDIVSTFQVSPLRLDLWILLLFSVYYFGVHHWVNSILCGVLILIHKNFGIIYSIGYLQVLAVMGFLELFEQSSSLLSHVEKFKKLLKNFSPHIFIIFTFYIVSLLVFGNNQYSIYYQSLGIGFIKISEFTFFWYFPFIILSLTLLLLKLRMLVSLNYFSIGLFLVFFSIGNSIYFFGRSHENNLLNLSLIYVFTFYFFIDVLVVFINSRQPQKANFYYSKYFASFVSFVVLTLICITYEKNIFINLSKQFKNLNERKFIQTRKLEDHFISSLQEIKVATNESKKVYFMDADDFSFYYYGGFEEVGFVNPFAAWLFKDKLNEFLQNLLNDHYYIVCHKSFQILLNPLKYNAIYQLRDYVIIKK